MRRHLDVLTMTATPIPRTLSFCALGPARALHHRDPAHRPAAHLHLRRPYEDAVVKEAIQKELDRGGQVFYVHNRVQSLHTRLHFLQQLLPGVSIGVVHGQMSGPAIEKVMWEFLHRRHQILLATSIIESGIDIPTVNTLIVEEAEEFGLSQLYQLRGRVGRERQKAYCYLFYSPSVPLTAERESAPGGPAGIHGAGQRLPPGHAGHGDPRRGQPPGPAAARVHRRGGAGPLLAAPAGGNRPAERAGRPGRAAFPSLDLAVHAFLPHEYMPGEELRILFYKKLCRADTPAALDAVRAELEDRFGPPPPEAQTLLEVSSLR